jgi:predicted phage baseplate assembly protein
VTVTNHWAAFGGADRETLEPAQVRARRATTTPFQAVTSGDYEVLTCDTPGLRVARAKAFPLTAPSVEDTSRLKEAKASVTIVVAPYSVSRNPTPSPGFCKTVLRHLENHRLITTRIHVIGPYYVGVSIQATVYLRPRASEASTRTRIAETLTEFLDPIRGGPDRDGWPFGRSVYQSEIYQTIENVDGVDYVKDIQLAKKGGSSTQTPAQEKKADIEIPPHSLVYLDPANLSLQIFPADPKRVAHGGVA